MAENANTPLDPFTTREGSLAVTEEGLADLIAGMRRKVSNFERGKTNLTIAGAHATHAAMRLDADLTVSVFADKVGMSRASVYIWRRAGIAVMDLGVEVGDETWTLLTGRGGANAVPVTWVLDGLGRDGLGEEESRKTVNGKVRKGKANIAPTREDLDWALDHVFSKTEDGVIKRKTADIENRLRVEAGLEPNESGESDEDVANDVATNVGDRSKAAAKYLADHLSELTSEQWEAIAPHIRAIAAETRKRTDVAEAAGDLAS